MGGRCPANPLQGLCQGNGAALACWLMLSLLLLHCYQQSGYRSAILAPISLKLISFLGNIYVNNIDLVITQPHIQSAADVWEKLQHSVTTWGGLLITTGGALNPSKCCWYMVYYDYKDGEWQYSPKVNRTLEIPLANGETAPITQLETNEAQKILGIWSCPAGSNNKHI
jgi:hypothetical protein